MKNKLETATLVTFDDFIDACAEEVNKLCRGIKERREVMEEWSPYDLDDFSYEILKIYIKYGYGIFKMYNQTFLEINDETAMLTIEEFFLKVEERRKRNKDDK